MKFLDVKRIDWVPATVIAACVMHNVCLDKNDNFLDYMIDGQQIVENYQTDFMAPTDRNRIAEQIRNDIALTMI